MLKYWLPHSISKILRLYVTQKSMGIELYTIRCLCKKKNEMLYCERILIEVIWPRQKQIHM